MMDVYKELARQADGKGEEAARNSVIRNLAQMNYRSAPRTLEGRHDGRNFRIYHWSNTPAGDLLLVTGSSVISELIHGSQLSATPESGAVYVLGSLAGGKVAAKVEAYLKSAAVEKAAKKAAGDGIPPTKATSPKPERAAEGTRAPRAAKPKVEVVERKRTGGRKTGEAHKPDAEAYRRQREAEEAEAARRRASADRTPPRPPTRAEIAAGRISGVDVTGSAARGAGHGVYRPGQSFTPRPKPPTRAEIAAARTSGADVTGSAARGAGHGVYRPGQSFTPRPGASAANEKNELLSGLNDLLKMLG